MTTYTYIGDGNPDGMIFGTATTEKIGFFGATPIVQPTTASQAAFVVTTTATATTALLEADMSELGILVNALRLALVNLGLIKGS
jgi:hypothetical protein